MTNYVEDIIETITDAAITSKVKAHFLTNKDINVNDISVETENGVVVLTGTVTSADIADKAVSITQQIKGVKEVINNIEI